MGGGDLARSICADVARGAIIGRGLTAQGHALAESGRPRERGRRDYTSSWGSPLPGSAHACAAVQDDDSMVPDTWTSPRVSKHSYRSSSSPSGATWTHSSVPDTDRPS